MAAERRLDAEMEYALVERLVHATKLSTLASGGSPLDWAVCTMAAAKIAQMAAGSASDEDAAAVKLAIDEAMVRLQPAIDKALASTRARIESLKQQAPLSAGSTEKN